MWRRSENIVKTLRNPIISRFVGNFESKIFTFFEERDLKYFMELVDCALITLIVFSSIRRLQEDPPTGVSGAPTDNNIMIWNAVIFGPHDTPFEDGTFKLTIEFTEEYPNKPPTVRFVSKVFHPNVYADGGICLDILQNRWSPTYDVSAILTSIQVSLLFRFSVWAYRFHHHFHVLCFRLFFFLVVTNLLVLWDERKYSKYLRL